MTDVPDLTKEPGPEPGQDSVPPEAIVAIPVRHWGRWVGALVVCALLAWLAWSFVNSDIRWEVVGEYLTYDRIVEGAANTLWITVLSMLIGLVLGMLLAVMRLSDNPVLSNVAWGYIWFFRGTPVLVQLVLWYNLSIIFDTMNFGFYKDETNDIITPFVAALLGLGLNEAAYMAEIARAGILSVDHGQTEAAQALGMNKAKTTRRIVLPQAMRVIIPPTGNEFINMLKTSSLVSVVQFEDLFWAADIVGSRGNLVMELFVVATVWYLMLTTVFSIGQYYLERHYAKGSDRALPPTPLQRMRAHLTSFRTKSQVGGTTV
ncbi:amino acid ABC transporter permease [Streptomyces marincola]|uniref:amino acid ABC transporter permease n=1 Tax=Streptomyces marincola TaxID=2878388 RepID=UPI00384F8CF5